MVYTKQRATLNEIKYTYFLLLRRAINSNSRGLNYLHGSFIHSSVNFNNNRKVEVKNAILSPYNSLDLLRRWFNDEVIKESRRTCRDIKRASTSRTRRCARSLEELLIEIEKKKENRGREERSERREKEKREKGGKKKTGLTVKRLPTQSVSFAFQKVIDTLKEIALISTDDSSPLKRYLEKISIALYSSRNEAASNSSSFFYIFPFDSHRPISLNRDVEKRKIEFNALDRLEHWNKIKYRVQCDTLTAKAGYQAAITSGVV